MSDTHDKTCPLDDSATPALTCIIIKLYYMNKIRTDHANEAASFIFYSLWAISLIIKPIN